MEEGKFGVGAAGGRCETRVAVREAVGVGRVPGQEKISSLSFNDEKMKRSCVCCRGVGILLSHGRCDVYPDSWKGMGG